MAEAVQLVSSPRNPTTSMPSAEEAARSDKFRSTSVWAAWYAAPVESMAEALDCVAMKPVKEVIPHREPFLFVDEVIDLTESSIVARRVVRPDEPQFDGHYPGRPIMPGVLLCEAVLQAGAYLMSHKLDMGTGDLGGAPVVTRMNKVRFKRMVKPGDELTIQATHVRSLMGAHMMNGSIRSGGRLVCSLEFSVMLVPDGDAAAD